MSTFVSKQADRAELGLDAQKRTYISRQALLFEKMRSELFTQYAGKWVLFEDNQVLDVDENHRVLLERVSKAMGNKPVLSKKVELLPSDS